MQQPKLNAIGLIVLSSDQRFTSLVRRRYDAGDTDEMSDDLEVVQIRLENDQDSV